MFTTHFKTKLVVVTILFTSLFTSFLFANCDMMALIAKKGHSIGWINGSEGSWETPNDPHDYFKFLYDRSPYNPDGYGIIYIDCDGYIPEIDYPDVIGYPTLFNDVSGQAWYVIPNETYGNYTITLYPGPYENAKSEILYSSNEVGIVLGHVRNATEYIGNHPFQIVCDTNGDGIDETFMFMHNGNVTEMVETFRTDIISMYPDWFTDNPSNWKGDPTTTTDWIDSEMYFHYLIAHVKNANGNVMKGIYNALGNVNTEYEPETSINTGMLENDVNANFVLSDGENLYLYRNCGDVNHTIAFDEYDSGFWGVQTSNTNNQFEQMTQNSFVIISPYGTPTVMYSFLMSDIYHNYPEYCSYFKYNFISGEINNNTANLNIHYRNTYISGDTYIDAGQPLDLESVIVGSYTFNPEIKFAGHQNLKIYGTLNVHEYASLNLSNSSTVEVLNSGLLFLDWGSTITGSTPTTYEATPPGHQTGGEKPIPGDRIIAQNGGMITTSDDYQNPGDEIIIGSGLPEGEEQLWDGIFIQNPSEDVNYWFVNCDISWIRKLSIENIGESRNTANLKLYLTDFCNAGQIVARDGHKLSIHGEEGDLCYFQNNTPIPITAYESPVDISYC